MSIHRKKSTSRDKSTCPWNSIPERQYGPAPWWAWLGDMSPERVDRQLKHFLDMEIYEIIIIPLYGLKPEYLGKAYFDLYRHTCRRCREWDMTLWIYDEFNWPSGTCAGRVLRDFPDARRQVIRFSWPRAGYRGRPEWKIEDYQGFDLASYGAEWALNSTGRLDVLNAMAVRRYIEMTHEAYRREVCDYFGDVILGFFTDEPTCARGGANLPYTPQLFDLFRARYGYDLKPHLRRLVMDTSQSVRVRQDYWALVIELFQKNFFRQYAAWCREHGLKMTGHLLYEEILAGNLACNGDVYDMLSEMQVPAIDLLESGTSFDGPGCCYHRAFGDQTSLDVTGKLIDSIACFAGKDRTLCEAFGCSPNSATAQLYKRAADFLFHHGLSMINDNLFADSLTSFRKFCGGHAFWTPWVKHYRLLSRHFQTLSWLNSTSRLVTQVGLYYPGLDTRVRYSVPGAMFAGPQYLDSDWQTTQQAIYRLSHGLIQRQWNYYYLFDQVLRQARVTNGKLRIRNFECRVLIFPNIRYVPEDVASVLRKFVAAGGHMICVGKAPKVVSKDGTVRSGRWHPADRVVEIMSGLDDVVPEVIRHLEKTARRAVMLRGYGLQDVMATHRNTRAQEVLFITNFGAAAAAFEIKSDRRWRRLDTVTRDLTKQSESRWRLRPNESVLLARSSAKSKAISAPEPETPTIMLSHDWKLRLPGGNVFSLPVQIYGGPETARPPDLTDDSQWSLPCLEASTRELVPEKAYWLRHEIMTDYVPRCLTLVVDGEDRIEVYWNGRRRPLEHKRIVWDDANRSCDLRRGMRRGANQLLIRYRPAPIRNYVSRVVPLTDLPPVVMTGDFRLTELKRMQKQTILTALPGTIRTGTMASQGYPGFAGVAEYSQTIRLKSVDRQAVLDLGHQNDMFEVEINGRSAGILAWPPYRVKVGHLLKGGTNRLVLRLYSTLGGILSRYFMNVTQNKPPMGLLETPRLTGCR